MLRDIVVFERDEGEPLDFRLIRGKLPPGAKPLAIANHHGFFVSEGEWFTRSQVAVYAERQSGYRSA